MILLNEYLLIIIMNRKLGKKIKQKRQELGLSQEKLGELSKLHRTYISLLERGLKSPTILTTNKIAKALNMNISELLEGL